MGRKVRFKGIRVNGKSGGCFDDLFIFSDRIVYSKKKKTLSFERVLEILDLNYLPAGKSISLFFALESIRYWASLESLDC